MAFSLNFSFSSVIQSLDTVLGLESDAHLEQGVRGCIASSESLGWAAARPVALELRTCCCVRLSS